MVFNGAGLNAGNTFETGQRIIESLKIDKSRLMVITQQFIEGVYLDEKGLLFWNQRVFKVLCPLGAFLPLLWWE
jgi:hypothetical protein